MGLLTASCQERNTTTAPLQLSPPLVNDLQKMNLATHSRHTLVASIRLSRISAGRVTHRLAVLPLHTDHMLDELKFLF